MYEVAIIDLLYFLAIIEPIFCNYILLPLCVMLNSHELAYVVLFPRYGRVAIKGKLILPFLVECLAYTYILILPPYYCLDLAYLWFIINIGRLLFCGSLPLYTTWSLSASLIHIIFFSWVTLPFTILRLISEII
jgi:hypothetical protein